MKSPGSQRSAPDAGPQSVANERARELVKAHGQTFAERAGVEVADEPDALWQLLVVAQLLAARIRADAALASARELFKAGWINPQAMRASTWQQRVDALGRGGYRRYDFSTSTRLGENATHIQDRWNDDLRNLRGVAADDPRAILKLLQEFGGIGPTGAGIFLREAQGVWALTEPFVDKLVLKGARAASMPESAAELAELVPREDLPRLCAALVEVARRPALAKSLPEN